MRYGLRVDEGEGLIDMYRQSRAAGFGAEVKRRIMLGTYALSSGYYDAYYLKAQKVRTLIRRDFLEAFEKVDVLLTPVAPTPAFRLGEKIADPLQMYLSDIFTIPVNLAGTCALSLPCGLFRRRAADRRCSSSAAPSAKRRCCAPATPSSRRRNGTREKLKSNLSFVIRH